MKYYPTVLTAKPQYAFTYFHKENGVLKTLYFLDETYAKQVQKDYTQDLDLITGEVVKI